jgi:mannose-6-phosphate isomerase-like protein (cupin superfamily)
LGRGAAVAVPAGAAHRMTETSADLELLEVTLPAALQIKSAAPPT